MTAPTPPHLIDALADLDDPAPPRRQPGQLVELFLADRDDVPTVRIANRERIAFEKTAARHPEWPSIEAGQHFAMTFMVYVAAKRDGLVSCTFDQFCELLEDWEAVKDAPADPTRPGA